MYVNSLILFAERQEKPLMQEILNSFNGYISSDDLKNKVLIHFFQGFIDNDRDKIDEALGLLKRFELNFHHHFLSKLLEKQ